MATVDPYAAPNAMGGAASPEFYQPKVFSFSGRIGRLRYLAYSFLITVITYGSMLLLSVFGVFSLGAGDGSGGVFMGLSAILIIVLSLAMMVFAFAFAVRRLNDFDTTGWLSLLMIVPLVNLIMVLVLVFVPGTATENKYGPPPVANSVWAIIGGLMYPLLFVVGGILAAVAIPAYQDYVQRAAEMEMQQPE